MTTASFRVSMEGTDNLSAALVPATGAMRLLKEEAKDLNLRAVALTTALADVRSQIALGAISEKEGAAQVAAYKQQIKELNDVARTNATLQRTVTNTTQTLGAATDQTTRHINRAVFGIQSMSIAMQGGRVSAQGLVSALTGLGIGSGPFLVITAGLSVIGGLLLQMGNQGEEAAQKIEDAASSAISAVDRISNRGRLQGIIAGLEAKERGGADANDPIGLAIARAGGRGGTLTTEEAATLNAARARLAELGRSGGGGRAAPARGGAALGISRGQTGKVGPLDKLDELFGTPVVETGINKAALAIDRLKSSMDRVNPTLDKFSQAFSIGIGAALDVAASGGHVFQAFTSAILGALSREARGKAVFEAAEGFAALGRGLFLGDPKAFAAAGAHFKAAALYGGAAVVTGALAGGGASAAAGRAAPATGTVGGSGGPVTIIQFVTPDGRQVSQHVVETAGRQQRLGAPTRVSLNAVVVGGPIARAA